jgi:16S rRNA (cytidine1402-2'-O)-methyltransferase
MESILKGLHDELRLCVAADITGSGENIRTKSLRDWKMDRPKIPKVPALFLLGR